jgi:hypothetical protein
MLQAASHLAYSFRRKQEVSAMAATAAPIALSGDRKAFGCLFGHLPENLQSIDVEQNSCFFGVLARNNFKSRKDKRLPGWEGV